MCLVALFATDTKIQTPFEEPLHPHDVTTVAEFIIGPFYMEQSRVHGTFWRLQQVLRN